MDRSKGAQKLHGVYAIFCLTNGKFYVGSAAGKYGIQGRIAIHISELRRGVHHSPYLQNSFNKYGIGKFEVLILELTLPADAVAAEQRFLDELKPAFNTQRTAGSWLGEKHSPETREKMRLSAMGRPVTKEARRKIGAANSGRKLTAEQRRKISIAVRGRKHSPETCQKIRMIKAKSFRVEFEGQIIEGTSIRDFCRRRNLNNAAFGAVLLGRRKSHKGYRLAIGEGFGEKVKETGKF